MTTDTEVLRAQFEQYINPEGDVKLHWQPAGHYAGHGVQQSWLDFQAGHAAAKAETAAAGEPVAWMAVVTHPRSQGPQAHFVSDAKLARQWDYNGVVDGEPCIVQPLFTAHQLAAAVAANNSEHAHAMAVLRQIADMPRRTREQRLASACVRFLDAIRAGEPSDG